MCSWQEPSPGLRERKESIDAELKSLLSPMEEKEEERVVGGKRPSIAVHVCLSLAVFRVLSLCGTLAITDTIPFPPLSSLPPLTSYPPPFHLFLSHICSSSPPLPTHNTLL